MVSDSELPGEEKRQQKYRTRGFCCGDGVSEARVCSGSVSSSAQLNGTPLAERLSQ